MTQQACHLGDEVRSYCTFEHSFSYIKVLKAKTIIVDQGHTRGPKVKRNYCTNLICHEPSHMELWGFHP